MDFSELVKLRQSDRKYRDTPVGQDELNRCMEAARLSPSACNSQPWKFIVVDDLAIRNAVAECAAGMGMNKFVAQAPVVIAVVLEKMNLSASLGSVIKDKEYSLLDIGAAANQFCLQAADLGLGTCMIGWFDEKKLKQLLGVPRSKRIPLLITLGFPDSPTRVKTRKSMDLISARNKY